MQVSCPVVMELPLLPAGLLYVDSAALRVWGNGLQWRVVLSSTTPVLKGFSCIQITYHKLIPVPVINQAFVITPKDVWNTWVFKPLFIVFMFEDFILSSKYRNAITIY